LNSEVGQQWAFNRSESFSLNYRKSCFYGGFLQITQSSCSFDDEALLSEALSILFEASTLTQPSKRCSVGCRGCLSAALMVISSYVLHNFLESSRGPMKLSALPWPIDDESTFVLGYYLASLGRHILHADSLNDGSLPVTQYQVKRLDFVGLQSAYLQLYASSFGVVYAKFTQELIPMAFLPAFDTPVSPKPKVRKYADKVEPLHVSLRWPHAAIGALIDFGPYVPLVAFPEVREMYAKKRRFLFETGCNGFSSSPQYLIDSYAAFMPFTDVLLFEPNPKAEMHVPQAYEKRYNFTTMPIYLEVFTGTQYDIIRIIRETVTKEDYVVLKFDVDVNDQVVGLEWPFVYSFVESGASELVDELYIEFFFHSNFWRWAFHHNWEAFDMLRYLREHGVVVHHWP
jgi:hypothetical protein